MWKSAYVGVYQLLNWKMHGETLKHLHSSQHQTSTHGIRPNFVYRILALSFHEGRGFTNHYLLDDFQMKPWASFCPMSPRYLAHYKFALTTFQYMCWRSADTHGNKRIRNCIDTLRFKQKLRPEMLFGIDCLWSAVRYTSQSSWKPNSNTMEPDWPQHGCLAAYIVAQQYSSATSPHCCFHVRQEKFCAPFKSVIFHFCVSF